MTTQSLLFGWLVATACGLVYHLVRGGRLRRLALYVSAAWVAFFLGHWVGGALGWTSLRVGPLNLLPALMGTLLGLVAADVLLGSEGSAQRERRRR